MTPAEILEFLEVFTGDAFDVPADVAVAYFQGKGLQPTFSYADMIGDAHDQAFTVAKMMDLDLLAHVRKSLDDALATGESFNDWRKKLEPALKKAGWWGEKDMVDPLTGNVVTAQLGSPSRLDLIFRTNMQNAYAVGQWQEIIAQADIAPFLMYDAIDDDVTRPEHRAWDTTVLPVVHPWWHTHFPPNGYSCRCSVIQLDGDEVEALGLEVNANAPADGTYTWKNPRTNSEHKIPNGIDPGFNRNPGIQFHQNLQKLAAEKIGALPDDMAVVAKRALAPILDPETAAKLAAEARETAAQQIAQAKINAATRANTPYLAPAIKNVQSTKAGAALKPSEILAAATDKAAKKELSDQLAKYKHAILGGKEPGPNAKAAFAKLTPDDQTAITTQIAQQAASNAAQESLDKLVAGQGTLTAKNALKQLQNSGLADTLSPVQLLSKVDELALQMQTKALNTAAVNGYKKKAIDGKIPTPAQKAAFDALPDIEKAQLLDAVDKAKTPTPITTEAHQVSLATNEPAKINTASLTQIGPQKGSNPGGLYQDTDTGEKWYIKQPGSLDKVNNEVLAGKLYQAAGVAVPDLEVLTMGGQPAIASRIVDGLSKGTAELLGKTAGAHDSFVVDAWLGNWDVVGLEYDNMLLKAGRVVRVDTGGALRYRAQGTLKGQAWGNTVDELESLRNPNLNRQAATVFGKISQDDLVAGARKVLAIDEAHIRALVKQYGPASPLEADNLVETLLARQADIARRFPDAVKPKLAPVPADLGARVTAAEVKTIKDARLNGYGMETDTDMIEDQEVLVWHERVKGKANVTSASLKVRGTGVDKLEELIVTSGSGSLNVVGNINGKILDAVKGIRKFEESTGLRAQDIQRAKAAVDEFNAMTQRVLNAVKAGHITPETIQKFTEHYGPWISALRQVASMQPGTTIKNYWKGPKDLFRGLDDPPIIGTPGTGPKFLKKQGTPYTIKEIRSGRAEDTGKASNAPAAVYYEMERSDGTVVRYFAKDNPYFALRGRVEIRTPGVDETAATRVFDTLEDLGISGKRSTGLDAEELYLTQLAYSRVRGFRDLTNALEDITDQAARVDILKARLSKAIGSDVTALPGYNPRGQYQAFGHGHRQRYRPDLQGPEWQQFRKDYRLHHNITNGSMSQAVDQILNAGGSMAPTTDKLRRGIAIGGMSPVADLQSGGASYFFTRIKSARSAKATQGMVWRTDLLGRMDAISYSDDKFGRVTDDFVLQNRKNGIDEWKAAAGNSSNETIFKNSLSLFDGLETIVTKTAAERQQVIDVFKKHGYQQFPDGRNLEDVIK